MGYNFRKIGMTTEELKSESLKRKCTVRLWKLSRKTVESWTIHRLPTNTDEESVFKVYCDICGRRFFRMKLLKDHKFRIHNSNQSENKCTICGRILSDGHSLSKHMNTHKTSRYQCPSCGKSIFKNEQNKNVRKIIHKDILECSFCGDTLVNMSVQKKLKVREKPFQCSVCEKSFTLFCYRKTHFQNCHSKNRPFKCSFCESSFTNGPGLKIHEKIHKGDKPHSCSICKKRFYTLWKKNDHFKRLHTKEKFHFCTMCNKKLYSMPELTVHLRSHTGERPFKCSVCSKDFTCKSNLNRHMKLHEEKSYKCNLCDEMFVTQGEKSRHVARRHTKIKSHFCSMCDKSFYCIRDLSQHIRNHTGEKPYKCNKCEKQFATGDGLHIHVKTIHSGQPLYECTECFKQYPYKTGLQRHMKIHT